MIEQGSIGHKKGEEPQVRAELYAQMNLISYFWHTKQLIERIEQFVRLLLVFNVERGNEGYRKCGAKPAIIQTRH